MEEVKSENVYSTYTEFYLNELYPSAIMFGMSSTEFWDEDPQLYWAYRFSYEKRMEFEQKKEIEQIRLACWLQGRANETAYSIALNNAFGKKKIEYPSFKEFYKTKKDKNKVVQELTKRLEGVTDKDVRGQIEFNYWARLGRE